jgi:hypothetical protein
MYGVRYTNRLMCSIAAVNQFIGEKATTIWFYQGKEPPQKSKAVTVTGRRALRRRGSHVLYTTWR